jgi:hypothetical protein
MAASRSLNKAFVPTADPAHQYVFRSGEYGSMYQYWWRDRTGNYVRYSNAPVDHPDFDPIAGPPMIEPEQPFQEKNPEFYTQEGFKRSMAAPQGVEPIRNSAYHQADPRNIWFEVVQSPNGVQYIYLDADVKENVDLYVQHQLRVADAALPMAREYATQLFTGDHVKDRLTAFMIMLCDQGFYEPEELCEATVGDVEFTDQVVTLLGRRFICDLNLFDFITSLVATRPPTEPLFVWDTMHGKLPIGINYLYGVFASLKLSPKFVLCWNASHLFSRIVNRLALEQVPFEEAEDRAFNELGRTLTTRDDVRYLVDFRLREELMRNYSTGMAKGLTRLSVDDYGVAVIRSDLTSLRQDEQEFSTWLHQTPLHDLTPAELAEVEQTVVDMNTPEEPQPGAEQDAAPPTSPGDGGGEEEAPADPQAVPA